MKRYKQLNYEERVSIRYGLFKGANIREISRMFERNLGTISEEIQREIIAYGTYFAESANRMFRQRKLNDKRM